MNFIETTKDGLTVLTAEEFNLGGAVHGFSTRPGGVSPPPYDSLNLGLGRGDDPTLVRENFRRFCAFVGADAERLACGRQVHGDAIRTVTEADAGKGLDRPRDFEADGLITDVAGLPLAVFTADCIPVLFHDPVHRAVGACHAGWRGTALGIAAKTVRRMEEVFGTDPADLRCAVGAGISRCCFETKADVPRAMRAALGAEAEPFLEGDGERYRVDLKSLNRLWLERAGVPRTQIAVSDRCTACDARLFWSHRRLGEARGSMAAVVQLVDATESRRSSV